MSQATANTGGVWWWFIRLLSGRPHIEIGGYLEGDRVADVYLRRWYLIPRNRVLNIYLHQFLRDDDDRALHDHPWDSLSILVRGQYEECVDVWPGALAREGRMPIWKQFSAPAVIRRSAEHSHRIQLIDGKPAWTLLITGPKRRKWGFWCPKGFVPWDAFTAGPNGEAIGKGCGD